MHRRRMSGRRTLADDVADDPAAVRQSNFVQACVKLRHMQISTALLSQKWKLLSPTIRVNLTTFAFEDVRFPVKIVFELLVVKAQCARTEHISLTKVAARTLFDHFFGSSHVISLMCVSLRFFVHLDHFHYYSSKLHGESRTTLHYRCRPPLQQYLL